MLAESAQAEELRRKFANPLFGAPDSVVLGYSPCGRFKASHYTLQQTNTPFHPRLSDRQEDLLN